MISLEDREAISAARDLTLPADLQTIIDEIARHAAQTGLLDLTHILVVEPGDTEDAIAREIGFSPLVSPLDGARYGQPGFAPYWAHLQRHNSWNELTITISNDGFAVILLIEDITGGPIQAMCREFAPA